MFATGSVWPQIEAGIIEAARTVGKRPEKECLSMTNRLHLSRNLSEPAEDIL